MAWAMPSLTVVVYRALTKYLTPALGDLHLFVPLALQYPGVQHTMLLFHGALLGERCV
jgi:hypothetical protein